MVLYEPIPKTEKTEKNAKMFKLDEDTTQMNLLQRVERLRMILYDLFFANRLKDVYGIYHDPKGYFIPHEKPEAFEKYESNHQPRSPYRYR